MITWRYTIRPRRQLRRDLQMGTHSVHIDPADHLELNSRTIVATGERDAWDHLVCEVNRQRGLWRR